MDGAEQAAYLEFSGDSAQLELTVLHLPELLQSDRTFHGRWCSVVDVRQSLLVHSAQRSRG